MERRNFFAALAAVVVAPFALLKPRKHEWLIDCFESKPRLPGCTTCVKLDDYDAHLKAHKEELRGSTRTGKYVRADPPKVWYWKS